MLGILEFIVWLFILPFALIALIAVSIVEAITTMFHVPTLYAGIWFCFAGSWLWGRKTPDPDREFVSIVEMVAQSHVGPSPTYLAFLAVGLLLIVISFSIRFKQPD